MTRTCLIAGILLLAWSTGCGRRASGPAESPSKVFGVAVVLVSGEKQTGGLGSQLDQPVVVQVNDAQGAPVTFASVKFAGSGGVTFSPDHGLTGSDGRFATNVSLGGVPGRYQIVAATPDFSGRPLEIRIDEIALGYQEMLGENLNESYCIRCHESGSSPERASNHDNLKARPHSFTEGAVMNAMSDANLAAIIGHGGAALGKSAEMPPYGATLTKPEIDALIALIRAVADPPYRPQGIFYASN